MDKSLERVIARLEGYEQYHVPLSGADHAEYCQSSNHLAPTPWPCREILVVQDIRRAMEIK